jgi:hypothetical protein
VDNKLRRVKIKIKKQARIITTVFGDGHGLNIG